MPTIEGQGGDQKPEYRIAITIYDNKTGEIVCKSSTYLDEARRMVEARERKRKTHP
jgi:hypothetical protein